MNDLGPLPPVHPREALVAAATHKLETALDEAVKGLTTAEALRAVTAAFSGWLAFVANIGIRRERAESAASSAARSGSPKAVDDSPEKRLADPADMPPEERIGKAIDIIAKHGGGDGAHHKAWALDQVLRLLMGEGAYRQWVAEREADGYEWEEGSP